MTTYRITCKGGEFLATERDRFEQLDGARIPAASLTPAHTVPCRGRVVSVARIVEEASA